MARYYLKSAYRASIRGFRTGDFSESDEINRYNREILKKLYDQLVAGDINSFYISYISKNSRSDDVWRNMTVWHRSTRPGVLIQESHMWFKNGELIPCSHHNINSFDDLMNEHGFTLGCYCYSRTA
ncbi:MAG: hypothetical protein J5966_05130 [Lachnospiraceae bacterium]|nr:hypothetical protein [Lachnospiraceae bacterium]